MSVNTTAKRTSPVDEAAAAALASVVRLAKVLRENPAQSGSELASHVSQVGGTDSQNAGLLGEVLSLLDLLHISPVVRLRGKGALLSPEGQNFVQDGLLHVTEELGPRVREVLSATAYAAEGIVPKADFRTTFEIADDALGYED